MQSEFEEVSQTFFQCRTMQLHFKFNSNIFGRFLKPVWGLLNRLFLPTYSLCSRKNSQTAERMVVKYYVGEFYETF